MENCFLLPLKHCAFYLNCKSKCDYHEKKKKINGKTNKPLWAHRSEWSPHKSFELWWPFSGGTWSFWSPHKPPRIQYSPHWTQIWGSSWRLPGHLWNKKCGKAIRVSTALCVVFVLMCWRHAATGDPGLTSS